MIEILCNRDQILFKVHSDGLTVTTSRITSYLHSCLHMGTVRCWQTETLGSLLAFCWAVTHASGKETYGEVASMTEVQLGWEALLWQINTSHQPNFWNV